VSYVLQVNILLVLVHAKIVPLVNILPIAEQPRVLIVVVVNKLLLTRALVIIVNLVNIPMEVNANNVQITLIPLTLELALVVLAHQVIKSIQPKMDAILALLDISQPMESSVNNVPMELIHRVLELSLVMAVNVVERFSIIQFVFSVCPVTTHLLRALVNYVKATPFPPPSVLVLVVLALMDLNLIPITLLVFFVILENSHQEDHHAKIVH